MVPDGGITRRRDEYKKLSVGFGIRGSGQDPYLRCWESNP